MEDRIPDGIASLAAAEGLGRHRLTIMPKRHGPLMTCNFVFMILVGLACFLLPGLWFLHHALRTPNFSRKAAARRLHFFEFGMVETDHGGVPAAFRWDSMTVLQEITDSYVNGVHIATGYRYTLHKGDGTVRKILNFYAEPERWGPFIQQEVTGFQLPGMLRMLDEGRTVTFADISVNRTGVATPRRGAVTWPEIESVRVSDGVLVLKKAGKSLSWSSRKVKDIPNFILFLALVDELRRSAAAR
ncbi:DUF6585 family protein [Streptomyces sp. NPDC026673]|uniref:DUF6585 family protein n=1 Tax=Streptomyces sp. NPDC026673 TaxID=3155724 RepID=UPI0033E8841B